MNRTALSLATLAAAAGAAGADVIQQSFSYEWTSNDVQHSFSFEPFDTAGGTRELTGVRVGFDGTIAMEITAQTYEGALEAGEWSAEASHTVVAYFNGGGIDLLQGLGGQWSDGITGDLGAGSNGQPGTPYVFTDTVGFANVVDVDSSYFGDFTGSEPLTGFMDGWFDGVVTPPDNGQWIEIFASMLSQEGTVTLTYEYENVPGPGALALLGVCGVVGVRRRR
ncbi:MAG TPA: hypothetical protein VFF69_15485 [Phycisphaerales bacterium]|nr:hypothetical protein [Phycisphaerales bacterium]